MSLEELTSLTDTNLGISAPKPIGSHLEEELQCVGFVEEYNDTEWLKLINYPYIRVYIFGNQVFVMSNPGETHTEAARVIRQLLENGEHVSREKFSCYNGACMAYYGTYSSGLIKDAKSDASMVRKHPLNPVTVVVAEISCSNSRKELAATIADYLSDYNDVSLAISWKIFIDSKTFKSVLRIYKKKPKYRTALDNIKIDENRRKVIENAQIGNKDALKYEVYNKQLWGSSKWFHNAGESDFNEFIDGVAQKIVDKEINEDDIKNFQDINFEVEEHLLAGCGSGFVKFKLSKEDVVEVLDAFRREKLFKSQLPELRKKHHIESSVESNKSIASCSHSGKKQHVPTFLSE